jgi:lysophospholipase
MQSCDLSEAPFNREVSEGPQNVEAFWAVAKDGVRLRLAHWRPVEAPKGTIFLLQGRSENLEKYGRTDEKLVEAGYAIFAIDWRGQGLSDRLAEDRMLGHVARFADYQIDLAAMKEAADALDLAKPWFFLGHSLGACVGLRAVIDGFPVSACAFTSPLWDINLPQIKRLAAWPISWAAQAIGQAQRYAPGTRGESYVLTTPFDKNRLTHDPAMYSYYVRLSEQLEDQQIGGPSMGWLFQALKETRALAKLPSPATPCLVLCGSEDSVISTSAVQERMSHWPQGRLEMIDGARHDLLCESPGIRNRVLSGICELFARQRV